MSKCGDFSTPLKCLKLIDVYGVPLSCRCKEFFKKLGGQVGEMVWINEATKHKQSFDKGRILVIVPLQNQVDNLVTVKVGNRSIQVRLKENSVPVSISWVNNFLGLNLGTEILEHRPRGMKVKKLLMMIVRVMVTFWQKRKRDNPEEVFSKEEVWVALSSCDGNKALGLDGFNLKFIKDNWDYIQDDFMRVIRIRFGKFWDNSGPIRSRTPPKTCKHRCLGHSVGHLHTPQSTSNKKGYVRDYGRLENSKWIWEVPLRRPVFNWEAEQWDSFWDIFWDCLESEQREGAVEFSDIWNGYCPFKVKIFVWQLMHGRVLVKDVLNKCGMLVGSNLDCHLCSGSIEIVNHLFLHCKWSWKLWQRCMNLWEVKSYLSSSLINWWKGLPKLCPMRKCTSAWSSMFSAMVWTIWETRNEKAFKDGDANVPQAEDMVRFRVTWWFKNLVKGFPNSITTLIWNIKEGCTNSIIIKSRKVVEWVPPPNGSFKFNVDSLTRSSPGQAELGEVLRDHREKVLCMFSNNVGIHDVVMTEIMALAKACFLCLGKTKLCGKIIEILW
ncbi:hypothetical protein Ddye_002858 [Dipteronia dyeriana]|uniref:Reverse transcriptase zinc-binding domain-containing protein n=1 Tax=Dipteronia dyeriana TaxID=168575 RepID=A0AAE0CUX5_9ROSI|nr:hypothetical protein Ddye_002858 [Dipteronia dyeriana]